MLPELAVSYDLIRKVGIVSIPAVIFAGISGGISSAVSILVAVLLVAGNFVLGALLLARAARVSPAAVAVAGLGGYVIRMTAVFGVFVVLVNQAWIDFPVFAIAVIVLHLATLFWETRAVSLTMAFPGLKPKGMT